MKHLITAGLVGVVLASGVALAAESGTPRRSQHAEQLRERWTQADANHDGMLSREEAQQGMPKLAQHFDQLDRNGDGQLTADELRAAVQALRDRRQHPRGSDN